MSDTKSPNRTLHTHELSIDELLALALSGDSQVDMGELTEAGKFIYQAGIRAGDTAIPAHMVWWQYKQWKKVGVTLSKHKFLAQFRKYFKLKKRDYMLDPAPFDLTTEAYFQMRKDFRDTVALNKKRNGQKKAGSGSPPKPRKTG